MAAKTPLVSVYITNYNYGKYIRQSVESVLNQTMQDFELFIIDDGSTDSSRKIIEEYAMHPQISIIYQRNKGLNITNNIALRVSRGKYIMRLDADDFLEPNALEIMSSKLEANPELGLVFPDYFLIDSVNTLIGEVQRLNFSNEVSLLDQPAHGACTMIRRDFLVALGGYDEDYTCQDGYELWIKFISHYKVENINKPLFYYRQHGNNLTSNESRILDTRFRIKENFINKNKIPTPKTLTIIPVRNTMIRGKNLPLEELAGETVLKRLVKTVTAAGKVGLVVITSADKEIREYYEGHLDGLSDKLHFVERPEEYARMNESLNKTIDFVLDQDIVKAFGPEAVMTVAIEYPFITHEVIDDAVNTLTIFGADSLLSVRPDNNMYYQHDGSGLKPILGQEKYTKLEREAIYKGVGGIVLSRLDGYHKHGKMLQGKIGHIVVDSKKSIGIFSDFELQLSQLLMQSEQEKEAVVS
jgi:CMP-N-acetylneuraminic acid synthetase